MGLWTLLAGALIGGAICSGGSNNKSSSNEVRVVDLNAKKVEFFDKYREIDVYLASFVGQRHGGISFFISGLIGGSKKAGIKPPYELIDALKELREYRNILGHDKTKWRALPDPKPSYIKILRNLSASLEVSLNDVIMLVEDGYQYIKDRNRY